MIEKMRALILTRRLLYMSYHEILCQNYYV